MLKQALAFALFLLPTAGIAQVKMGSNQVCYASGDPYYAQIHTSRVYMTMVECESAGGKDRQTANDPVSQAQVERGRAHRSTVTVPVSLSRMNRRFEDISVMDDWVIDTRADGCREQRDTLLSHTSNVSVQWHADGCRVRMGQWRDALDGKRLTDPESIELTHLVPLDWAMNRGAGTWTAEMRHRFYMDRRNLVTTTPEGRAAMNGKTPMEWRPYMPWAACHHAHTFWEITQSYPFQISQQEQVNLVAAVDQACQPITQDTVVALQNAQHDLVQAQQDAITQARQTYDAQQDALRAQNAPPAPAFIRLPDGSTRALSMEERWGGQWRTHIRPDIQQRTQGMAGITTQQPTMPQDQSTAERPPIALPGQYTTNDTAGLDQDPNYQNRFGQQGTLFATDQVDVGSPQDLGDFGDVVLPPSLEGLDRLGDDLPELDTPGQNPQAILEAIQNGMEGLNNNNTAADLEQSINRGE